MNRIGKKSNCKNCSHSNSSLTSNSSSNSSSVSMDVSSPLVESSHSSDPRSIHRDTSAVIKNQQVINNKHRSSLQMGSSQQSQSHHSSSSSSSRHHSSSSQERREEGGRREEGRRSHVQHLLQSSNNNSLPLSHSSPSLNVINNGKNQVQLSNSTNNFNVMKAEQFEMIRKRQYRVGLNLFNKSPPEVSTNIFGHSLSSLSPLPLFVQFFPTYFLWHFFQPFFCCLKILSGFNFFHTVRFLDNLLIQCLSKKLSVRVCIDSIHTNFFVPCFNQKHIHTISLFIWFIHPFLNCCSFNPLILLIV